MLSVNKAICLLGGVLALNSAWAVPANLRENYQPIVDRNPFGLRPPPPPPTNNVNQPPPVEKPKIEIFLTGIVSVPTAFGDPASQKQVFLKTQEANKKDAVQFYALKEGEGKDGISIVSIDDKERRVRIQTEDGETVLSFQTHGVTAPNAQPLPVPGQPGGAPGQPGAIPPPLSPGGIPQPQTAAYQPVQAQSNDNGRQNNFRSIPSRSVRSRIPNRGFGGNSPSSGFNGGNSPIGAVPGAGGDQAPPPVDPAEQYLRMHLDKIQKERQGIPMPPLPPVQ